MGITEEGFKALLEERDQKVVQFLVGEDDDGHCMEKIFAQMEPRTCIQGTAEWFLDRQLSGTSSTIAELVVAVAPLIADTDCVCDAFEKVLG